MVQTKIQKQRQAQRQSVNVIIHMAEKAKKRRQRKKRVRLAKSSGRISLVSNQQPEEHQRFFRPTINLPPNYVANGFTAPPLPLSRLAVKEEPIAVKKEPISNEPVTPVKAEKPSRLSDILSPLAKSTDARKAEFRLLKPLRKQVPNNARELERLFEDIEEGNYKPKPSERVGNKLQYEDDTQRFT